MTCSGVSAATVPKTCGWRLKQRTRWLKGWMQTYLVHTRRPRQLSRELGVENHLEQDIAEFLLQVIGVALVKGLENLVGLFEQEGFERCMGLLAVPGTTGRPSQTRHDLQQMFEEGARGLGHVRT